MRHVGFFEIADVVGCEMDVERTDGGNLTVFTCSHGLRQKFVFTLI